MIAELAIATSILAVIESDDFGEKLLRHILLGRAHEMLSELRSLDDEETESVLAWLNREVKPRLSGDALEQVDVVIVAFRAIEEFQEWLKENPESTNQERHDARDEIALSLAPTNHDLVVWSVYNALMNLMYEIP